MLKVAPGLYRHYKGGLYRVLYTALHTETEERLVIYKSTMDRNKIFARPEKMWYDRVEIDKVTIPRFAKIIS